MIQKGWFKFSFVSLLNCQISQILFGDIINLQDFEELRAWLFADTSRRPPAAFCQTKWQVLYALGTSPYGTSGQNSFTREFTIEVVKAHQMATYKMQHIETSLDDIISLQVFNELRGWLSLDTSRRPPAGFLTSLETSPIFAWPQ